MENSTQVFTQKKNGVVDTRLRDAIRDHAFWTAKISWAAIFSGVLVTFVSQLLLSLLGMGIGLATFNPENGHYPASELRIGTLVWWSASMLISLYLGGWTTGKMYLPKFRRELSMHGLLTWCTFTVVSFFMFSTSIGGLISGSNKLIGSVLSAAAENKNNPLDISGLVNDARTLLLHPAANTAGNSPATAGSQHTSLSPESGTTTEINPKYANPAESNGGQLFLNNVGAFFQTGDVQNPDTRETLITSLMHETGMSRVQATAKLNGWVSSYKDLNANSKVLIAERAKTFSIASIVAFFALIAGGLVTIWGASEAQKRHPISIKPQ